MGGCMRFPVHVSGSVSPTLRETWMLLLSFASHLAGLFLTSNLARDLKRICRLEDVSRALGMLIACVISCYLFQKQISLRKGYTWDQKPL